jgi:uncharacterized protein
MPSRFNESDLDRLEQYLNDPKRADTALPLDAIQGMFAALASSPAQVPPPIWLPEVLGESHAFANEAEAAEITAILQGLADETARQLNEGEGFDFILYGPEGEEEDLAAWAEGYLIGVDLADPPWEESAEQEDLENLLFPFLAITGQAKEMALEAGETWMSEEEEAELLDEIREGLANHLLDVRRYWFEKSIPPTARRDAPKVGRNDPCPCGSGKKYKACHGQ